MAQDRVKGYVVGYDIVGRKLVWSVKVKDQNSVHNNKKFTVTSCGQGTLLCEPAVDVTFRIESCQDGRETILMAADVRFLEDVQAGQIQKQPPEPGATMNIVVTEIAGDKYVWLTGHQTREDIAKDLDEPETLVAFLAFDIEDYEPDDDMSALFEAIKAITYTTSGAEALEKILEAVYNMGLQTSCKQAKGMSHDFSRVPQQ
ncbi:MAG: hypothetical protein AUJ34_03425 [Parcubacteria group bacterium CG1_02_41_12]|nr:MAG: hypothetical protein AUJ34_03425 [Parcubacteria group bacterium CG1_02_41_12]